MKIDSELYMKKLKELKDNVIDEKNYKTLILCNPSN